MLIVFFSCLLTWSADVIYVNSNDTLHNND